MFMSRKKQTLLQKCVRLLYASVSVREKAGGAAAYCPALLL